MNRGTLPPQSLYGANLARGHLAVLSIITAANAFIRCMRWVDTVAHSGRNALMRQYVTM